MIVDRSKWAEYKDAGKFELLGKRPTPLTAALDEAINFNMEIGKKRIERRIKALAMHLKTQLKSIPGVKLHTSLDPYLSAGLTVFSIKDIDPQRIVDYLREKYNIVVRTIGDKGKGTYGVRVSTHIFVSERDVDTLIEGTRFLAKQG
jgi:selenocysteine lyase/cysteine desulfurase